jgi:two-component system, OmpR family, response regulator
MGLVVIERPLPSLPAVPRAVPATRAAGRDMTAYQPDPSRAPSERPRSRGRILLIEDASDLVAVLVDILEEEGDAVVVCHSPAEARRFLRTSPFDLVITDGFSRLPQDIIANTAAVLTAAGATPVLLFTGHRIEREVAQAAGFCDLIPKPFELETLVRQIQKLLDPETRSSDRTIRPTAGMATAEEGERTHG